MGNICSRPVVESPQKDCQIDQARATLEDFKLETTLGSGSFGKVFLVSEKTTGTYFAMKAISKCKVKDKRLKTKVVCEREILASIKSDFVVKMHYAFQTPYKLYMVLEYLQGGELGFHLQKFGRFPVHYTRFFSSEIILALEDLHGNGIIYRDLKPENVLIDATGHIKLADFNLSKVLSKSRYIARTMCGTPEYIAPEIFKKLPQTYKVDYWSLGVLIYEMVHGFSPFYTQNRSDVYKGLKKGNFRWLKTSLMTSKSLYRRCYRSTPESDPIIYQPLRVWRIFIVLTGRQRD